MNKAKRKQLAQRGWKVGGAAEFLGLSAEESRFIELKLALSRRLRERREALKLTQFDLAQQLRSSQSRIAKMEAGDPSVSLDLLIRSLFALGATKRVLARAQGGGRGRRACDRGAGGAGIGDYRSAPDARGAGRGDAGQTVGRHRNAATYL